MIGRNRFSIFLWIYLKRSTWIKMSIFRSVFSHWWRTLTFWCSSIKVWMAPRINRNFQHSWRKYNRGRTLSSLPALSNPLNLDTKHISLSSEWMNYLILFTFTKIFWTIRNQLKVSFANTSAISSSISKRRLSKYNSKNQNHCCTFSLLSRKSTILSSTLSPDCL